MEQAYAKENLASAKLKKRTNACMTTNSTQFAQPRIIVIWHGTKLCSPKVKKNVRHFLCHHMAFLTLYDGQF